MKWLILIVLILLFALCFTLYKFIKLQKQKKIIEKDLSLLMKCFHKLRYGQLDVRINDLSKKNLQKTLNRLIETISDRESMILEYQKTLSEKNKSLEKLLKQEKESQRFKEDFIAALTHDMKTPIIGELNTIDFFLSGRLGEISEKQREVLELMKHSNEELICLVETILDTYKLEQTSLVLNTLKTNMRLFITEIVEEMNSIALANNVEVIFKSEHDEIEIQIDRLQIKRVIKNLISNAVSFSNMDSPVEITLDIYNDNEMKISVVNYGQNIPQEELQTIFQKYYSACNKFRKTGTGLGLYLSKQIVEAHNGSISVSCEDGQKTIFTVSLPLI